MNHAKVERVQSTSGIVVDSGGSDVKGVFHCK